MAVTFTPFQASGTSVLPPNQTMSPGQFLLSDNRRFSLLLQADGNLVIKDGEVVIWVADDNQPYSRTLYQKKMNEPLRFVIANNGMLYDPARRRMWIAESTHSIDKSLWYNTCMVIQDDGNLVIYDQRTGDLRWARFGFAPGRIPKPTERFTKVLPDGKEIYEWKFSLGPL
ncbi:hypothetical protein IMF27_02510 [Pseudomonas sp. PCH199]|uniref:hypothetical protein n=1 Tax=unclassified Pseudomonas TaxID=196821 RepID=UPI000BDA78B3|nr:MULTISPECIES: hypothetical protein [unclassified Pseudomonas]MCW8274716.1 hypothetical protein [Pseudomonas sp. PCH199]PAM85381.1 hypothetical protein CES87_02560 [Pseudomonas sp. ERMR1:02]